MPRLCAGLVREVERRAHELLGRTSDPEHVGAVVLLALELGSADAAFLATGMHGTAIIDGHAVELGRRTIVGGET